MKHIAALFAFNEFQLMDVAGPAAVFGVANSTIGHDLYDVRIVSPAGGLVRSSCGVSLQSQATSKVPAHSVGTLLIAGGSSAALARAAKSAAARKWIPRCIRASARFGSVCSGAYLLAELGELDGLRIATHWASCDDLAKRFPDVRVDSNPLFVIDGKAWTSAGVTTGIDMALAMVERDVDRSVADKIAKFLVLYLRRPGYQSQFSDLMKVQASAGTAFAELAGWIQIRLHQRLDIPTLAARVGLSERTFYRKFVAATGQTPAHFVANVRLDAARALLAANLPLKTIAARTGVRSVARLNDAFERRFGIKPSLFRQMHHVDLAAENRRRKSSNRHARS
jgi:transcriptional regulator GlxA family with amidase domain